MGFRGPQRQPDSIRGKVENKGLIPEPIQEDLFPAEWLKGKALKEFHRLVMLNRAAGVSIRGVDVDQYMDLAVAIVEMQNETENAAKLAWGRHVSELRSQLNMGPRNRQRAGVKDTKKPAAKNSTLSFIERAKK